MCVDIKNILYKKSLIRLITGTNVLDEGCPLFDQTEIPLIYSQFLRS